MKNTRTRLNLQILLAFIMLLGVQNAFAQQSRYNSSTFRVAFQTPSGSVKDVESTERRIIYLGKVGKSGVPPRLEFVVADMEVAEEASKLLGTEEGLDLFVNSALEVFKEGMKGAQFDIKEKKSIQIVGLNAVKVVAKIKYSGVKMRYASFSVIVPRHQRMYNFIVLSLEEDFDKWMPLAQASIDSFALVNSVH